MAQKRTEIPAGFKNGYLEYVREAQTRVNSYQKVRYVVARCICGVEKEYLLGNFFRGNSRSCGCMSRKMDKETKWRNEMEGISVTRDLYTMRIASEAAEKKRLSDLYEKISAAEKRLDFADMMEWTLVLLERGDKSEILVQEEEMTVGNFVF